jgi:hypothetical protein
LYCLELSIGSVEEKKKEGPKKIPKAFYGQIYTLVHFGIGVYLQRPWDMAGITISQAASC